MPLIALNICLSVTRLGVFSLTMLAARVCWSAEVFRMKPVRLWFRSLRTRLGVYHGLEFDGRQPAEPGFSASAVPPFFTPGDKRDTKLVSGVHGLWSDVVFAV